MFCLLGLWCFVIPWGNAQRMRRDTSLLIQRCVRNFSRLIFFKETRLVRPAADPPAQGGLWVGCPAKSTEYKNLLRALSEWIPFLWQTAVFWIPVTRCGSNFADNYRGPRLPSRIRGGGGSWRWWWLVIYVIWLAWIPLSVVREKVHGIVWGTYVSSPMSVPRESVRAFRKELFEFPGGRSARKRFYAVFWNIPAFSEEGSFDIFSTSVAVVIVPWLDISRSYVKHSVHDVKWGYCNRRDYIRGAQIFQKSREASTNYRRQNCDISSLQRTHKYLGSSFQKSVATRLPGAWDLCTSALSKAVEPLKIFIVNAENFIWSAYMVHLTERQVGDDSDAHCRSWYGNFIAGREVYEIFSVFAELYWMWERYSLNSHWKKLQPMNW